MENFDQMLKKGKFMQPFCTHFNLSERNLLLLLENVAGSRVTDFSVHSSTAEDQKHRDRQLATFRYVRQSGDVGEVTLFVKRCVWKRKSEAIHYRYLAAAGIPTPRLYGAIDNSDGEEIIFLEPLTSVGFHDQDEMEWREMLSLLAQFNACPVTPEYKLHLHPYEQVGQIGAGMWLTGLSASPSDTQVEAGLRACGIGDEAMPAYQRAAQTLFAQVQAQPQGLLHQDFLPDNFGWRGKREEVVVFDLHKNSVGPRFADVAPYLSAPDWSAHKAFLDDLGSGTSTRREVLTRYYLAEYARFGGVSVSPETFHAEVSALFWAHKVSSLLWLAEQQQETAMQEVMWFLHQASVNN